MTRKIFFAAAALFLCVPLALFPAFPSHAYTPGGVADMDVLLETDFLLETEVLFSAAPLELDDVTGPRSADFRPVSGNVINFWNINNELWIRMPMPKLREIEQSFPDKKAILVLQSEYITLVDFYIPAEHGVFAHSAYGIDACCMPSHPPTFLLSGTYAKGYAYLNVSAHIPVSFSVTIHDEPGYYSTATRSLTRRLIFYCSLAALTLTCFLFYMMTGDPGYSMLVLRQLGALIFLFALNGCLLYSFCQLYSFSAPSGKTVYISRWLGMGLYGLMEAFLCRRLFRTDEGPLWLRRLIYAHAWLSVVMAVSSFFASSYLTMSISAIVLAADIISFLAIGFLKFRHGYRIVCLFVLSRLAFVLANAALMARVLFTWRNSFVGTCIVIFYLLDPILLFMMMIPDTRRRFRSYFSMEDKDVSYWTLSERDSVTGLYNKACLLTLLDEKIKASQMADKHLAFMVMDIDNFQEYNDACGCREGEKLLVSLAKLTRQCLRDSDIAARHGGGEFAIALQGGTLPSTVLVAERIRQTFEKRGGASDNVPAVTLSIGISFMRHKDSVAALMQRGYDALNLARSSGRNRTEFEIAPLQPG